MYQSTRTLYLIRKERNFENSPVRTSITFAYTSKRDTFNVLLEKSG